MEDDDWGGNLDVYLSFNDMEGTYNLLKYIEFQEPWGEEIWASFRLKSRFWTKKAFLFLFFSISIMHLKTCTLVKKFLSYSFSHWAIMCYELATHWGRQGQFHLLDHTRQCVKHSNGLVGPTWWIIVVDRHFNQPIKHNLGGGPIHPLMSFSSRLERLCRILLL